MGGGGRRGDDDGRRQEMSGDLDDFWVKGVMCPFP